MPQKTSALTLLTICMVASMTLWFSATAVVPSLIAEYGINDDWAALLTTSVLTGFVVGTLTSSVLGLADRLDPRRFFMIATLISSISNAAILWVDPTSPSILICRFICGACMAGIYPVGMRLAATWAKNDLGLLIGILIGGITLGTHSPHLLNAIGGVDWRFTITGTSLTALVSALLINLVKIGPRHSVAPPFDPKAAVQSFTAPALRLANFGYLGHMWELFTMWAWLGVFLDSSFRLVMPAADAAPWSRLALFVCLGIGGALGCWLGGVLSDRYGRTTLTMGTMALSGTCCLFVGLLYGGDPWVLTVLCFIWSATAVADSAQFSSAIAELAPANRIGTMLTVQTCFGFLLTVVAIHILPPFLEVLTWRYAFMILAVGPFLGVWAMARLRAHPDSSKLADGRK